MKRVFVLLFVLFILSNSCAYALEASVLGMRKEFLKQSKEIKTSMVKSKDAILLNSLWDSCIMTTSQLDAYFLMLGIFTSIKEKDLTNTAINNITGWLKIIKNTCKLNVTSLNSVTRVFQENTLERIRVLKTHFVLLSNLIDKELEKINVIAKAAKKKRR